MSNPLIIPFIIACTLSVINFFLLWNNFRNINKNVKIRSTSYISNLDSISSNEKNILVNKLSLIRSIFSLMTYVFNNQHTKMLALAYLLFQFGFGLFLQSLSLNLAHNYHYAPSQIGKFFVVMAIAMTASMYLLQKLITKFINYKIQIKIGLITISTLFILYLILYKVNIFQLNYIYITWIVTAVFYILLPFITLGFTNLFAKSVVKEERGKIMGGCGQICSTAFFISALLVGKLTIISYSFILLISGISFMLSYIVLKKFFKFNILNN